MHLKLLVNKLIWNKHDHWMLFFFKFARTIPEDWEFLDKELQISHTSTATLQKAPLIFGICPFDMIATFLNSNRFDIIAISNLFKVFNTWGTSEILSFSKTA